ncbi:MAG TPA: hypothetical protein VM118_08020 [Acidobacteriota bacterium]|nr:hypothetical protein [Acidobacteriota bacterium]
MIASDDISSVKYQRIKLIHGADGVNDGDVSSANPLPVDGSGVTQPVSGTVTANAGTGTFTVSGTVTANVGTGTQPVSGTVTTNVGTGTRPVAGAIAHDAVDSGSPLKLGMRAIAHGTNPTEVASADRSHLYCNVAGVPFMIGGHPNVQTIRANYTAAQTDTAIVSTTEKIVVTRVSVMVANEGTVDVDVVIGFGAVNTPTTTGVILAHPGIAVGSGVVEGTGSGMLGVGAAGEDVRITCSNPTTGSPAVGSIDVLLSYYEVAA